MKRYAEYKDSGIEWIGEIPKAWEAKRLSHLFGFGRGASISKENRTENGIPCIHYGGIHFQYGFSVNPKTDDVWCVNAEWAFNTPKALLHQGDFMFADTSEDVEGSGNFTYFNSTEKAIAGQGIILLRPVENFVYRYMAYMFDSINFRRQIQSSVYGVKVFHPTQTILRKCFSLLPTIQEQKIIAAYLDRKTAAIDALIADKLRLIDLLKEKRQALISEAVTKGLDPTVPMKDSGVEWIGEIPEAWEVKRLKNSAKICNGQEYKNFEVEENGIPVYGSGGAFALSSKTIHDNPSVLLGRKGTINKPLYVIPPFWTVDTMYYTDVYSNCDAEFLFYLCTTIKFDYFQYGSAVPSMTQKDLGNIKFSFPKKEEQIKIVDCIKAKTSKMDTLIADIQTQIEKLKEYRQSIISEAVTGKVKI